MATVMRPRARLIAIAKKIVLLPFVGMVAAYVIKEKMNSIALKSVANVQMNIVVKEVLATKEKVNPTIVSRIVFVS